MNEINRQLVPKNVVAFEKMFSTEEQCVDYIFKLKYPKGYKCPICKNEKYWINKKYLLRCTKCKYEFSILEDTIFEYKRKPLILYFRAMWFIVTQKNGTNAINIQRQLGITYKSAWAWLHKLRRAMVRIDADKLSGTVEVDEAYLGGKNKGGKRGRGSENKTAIAVAVELPENTTELGRIRIEKILNCGKKELENFVISNIALGSTIITDSWSSYDELEVKGYIRIIEELEEGQEELQHVHLVISLLKRWILGTMQGSCSDKYTDYYLDEFIFRFNRRKSKDRGLLFYRLMEMAVSRPPTTVKEIKENEKRVTPDRK